MSKLINGCIPAKTECPYHRRCFKMTIGKCEHNGAYHQEAYACHTAREFQQMEQVKEQIAQSDKMWYDGLDVANAVLCNVYDSSGVMQGIRLVTGRSDIGFHTIDNKVFNRADPLYINRKLNKV